jgi:hypothetical protein
MLENKRGTYPAKVQNKLNSMEEVLFSGSEAEDLYISFLEEADPRFDSEKMLAAIFEAGIRSRGRELSENFVETVKSFYMNKFESNHLYELVAHLRSLGYFIPSPENSRDGEQGAVDANQDEDLLNEDTMQQLEFGQADEYMYDDDMM